MQPHEKIVVMARPPDSYEQLLVWKCGRYNVIYSDIMNDARTQYKLFSLVPVYSCKATINESTDMQNARRRICYRLPLVYLTTHRGNGRRMNKSQIYVHSVMVVGFTRDLCDVVTRRPEAVASRAQRGRYFRPEVLGSLASQPLSPRVSKERRSHWTRYLTDVE